MKNKRFIITILFFLAVSIVLPVQIAQAAYDAQPTSTLSEKNSTTDKKSVKITKKERNAYFSKSAFIGSSIGVGLKNYINSKGKGYLGHPVMLVQGCYSFANDASKNTTYKIKYKGKSYKAKDAIAASHVKRVFICMGTNDLWKDVKSTIKDYIKYIKGIQKRNPGVVIFIESTPPMCSARCRKYLNNKSIKKLNKAMKAYCSKKKDVYYIDIADGLRDSKGGLSRKYSSDGYVHLTSSAYKIWMNNVTKYVDQLLIAEKKAKKAVRRAEKNTTKENYDIAVTYINALESSTVKSKLKKRINKIKDACYATDAVLQN